MRKQVRGNQCLIVTPFDENGEIDKASTRRLINHCIKNGGHGILALGTVSEFFAMSVEERLAFMDLVAEEVAGRVPLGFFVTDSSTKWTVELARHAQSVGADYISVGAPYHKPSTLTSGVVFQHVRSVAEAVSIDLFLYDGGGGYDFPLADMVEMARAFGNVRGAKMSGSVVGKIAQLHQALGKDFVCLSGNPPLYFLMMVQGAVGITCAASNFYPRECTQMFELFESGDVDGARKVFNYRLLPLMVDVCPPVVKQLLYWQGTIDSPAVRLPKMPLGDKYKAELLQTARMLGHELPRAAGLETKTS